MTQVHHQLVGYNRSSGNVAVEYEIPDVVLDYARAVASVDPDDTEAALCYRLTDHQARDIADAIGVSIDALANNYYMEGSSEPV